LAQLANDHNVKTVATNDSHYLKKEDAEIQAIMLAIATGGSGSGLEFSSNDLYLKNREQMITGHILPEWVDTTMEIFDRVDFELSFSGYQFPSFDIESTDEYNNFEEYMKRKGVI
jgi:DNA polymerase-3 subunit alpha